MRIESFEDFGKSTDRTIHGAVKIQYPVYNLHLKMLTKDVDPYFPIDRAIVKYATFQPDINHVYLSALIGLDESFVRWRINTLTEARFLAIKGTAYIVTENGERKYLAKDPVQADRTVYGNLVVDGITLGLLDISFYQNKAWLLDKKSDLLPHIALLGTNDIAIQKTLKKLEQMSPEEKSEHCLEAASHGYEVTGYDAQSLDDVYVVFSSDNETKQCRRDILYKNKVLGIQKLTEEAQKFYFSVYDGEFYNNQGYHPRQGDPFFSFSGEQIAAYLKKRYAAEEILPTDFKYAEKTDKNFPYPLTIKVTRNLLGRVKRRKRLIIDAINGSIFETLRVGAMKNVEIGFFCIHVEDKVPEYTALYSKMAKWEGRLNQQFVEQELSSLPDWRKNLVYLGCFEELEEIDIDQFINSYGNE